jgi:hypothetical protein
VGLIFGGVTFAIIYIFEGPLSHFVFFMKERGGTRDRKRDIKKQECKA